MVQSHWNTWETNPQFSGMIQSVGREFQSEPYDWQVLDPRAGPEERHAEGYSRLDEAVLDYFGDHSSAAGEYREFRLPDQGKYFYYQTVRAKESCLRCHDVRPAPGVPTDGVPPVGVAVGDLMAVVRVVMPDGLTKKAINWNRAILLATAIMTVFLAMLAAYLIVRYVIVKPLEHLRDVSDEVRRGNVQARAEIHTADEFEELGVAFNRMLRGLVDTQEELQKVNESLDGKVDELARANLHLYEMNRMKSDFLATMSHELRTPLNSIIGFSDVLGSIQSLDDKQRRYVQNIRNSGRMLLDMINDILDLAKIEAGKTEIRPVTFDVESVVSAQCDMARPMAEKKAIDVTFEIGPGLEAVEQDQAKVQQILANLLSNAVKFTPGGGRVEVNARLDDTTDPSRPEIVMDVSDSGVGIAAEEQQAIFEKFRQGKVFQKGDDAMTREISGTGLGLSIVRELCRLLGGDVTLESQLGRGSQFTIRLPARLQPARPTPGTTLALAD
jgi:signal transduction histidine kinase